MGKECFLAFGPIRFHSAGLVDWRLESVCCSDLEKAHAFAVERVSNVVEVSEGEGGVAARLDQDILIEGCR